MLLLAPLPFLLTLRRKRAASAQEAAPAATLARALRDATRFLRLLWWVALGCFVAAAVALLLLLLLPSAAPPVQRITANVAIPAAPVEGATEIAGSILYDRTSAFNEQLWVFGRDVRFAPMVENGADHTTVRYFVELAPTDGATPAGTDVRRGILKKNGLPGELVRLYRYAGFEVLPTHYVLFSSAEVMRWPYIVWASEFGVAGFLVGLGGIVQWLRRRRLARLAGAHRG